MADGPIPLIALAVAVGNFLGLIYLSLGRISRVESRVEILWEFLMRRGIVEAVDHGLLKHDSPLSVPIGIRDTYSHLISEVTDYYKAEGHKLPDVDLVLEIEKRFWPDIVKMSLTARVHEGACVAVVLNLIRPDAEIFKEFEPIIWEVDKLEGK